MINERHYTILRDRVKHFIPKAVRPALRSVEPLLIRCVRIVIPAVRPTMSEGKHFLNLGCGDVTHPAFVNVDARPAWHIHHIRPIYDLKPFRDDSVDLIYASHCLEHFSHLRVGAILKEWRRVLKPGGILRLGVPDFDQLVVIYQRAGMDIDEIQPYLMGGQDYPLNCHFAIFNKQSLTHLLISSGFRSVREWARGADELTSLPDCTGLVWERNGDRIPISLNIEAIK